MKFPKIRHITTFSLLFMASALFLLQGCGGSESGREGENASVNSNANGMVTIDGELSNCFADSMRLYKMVGSDARPIAAAALNSANSPNTFSMQVPLKERGFYLLGSQPRLAVGVILGGEGNIKMTGDCQNLNGSAAMPGSKDNTAYKQLMQRISGFQQQANMIQRNMQAFSQSDPSQLPRLQSDLDKINEKQFAYLDSVQALGNFMSKIASLYNFKPFGFQGTGSEYSNDREYFAGAFFGNLDLSDPEIGRLPQLFEKARFYTMNLANMMPAPDQILAKADPIIKTCPTGSEAHQAILLGFLAGLEQSRNEAYITLGRQYIGAFPGDQRSVAMISQKVASLEQFKVGAPAPDFKQQTPEGAELGLSDLKGQYVLLDFWASWCKPCRIENPNVVKAYNKYHKSGFEILGISLDKDKNRWLQAIQQDGLVWKHTSDLRGWQNQVAQMYSVSSIPATVLVDKEGKIMARNLRGQALERKLSEIFGY